MMPALFGLLLAAMQTQATPVLIKPQWDGSLCTLTVEGRTLTSETLYDAAVEWSRSGRPIAIVGALDVPYRCVGSTIFALQMSHYGRSPEIGVPPDFSIKLDAVVNFSASAAGCHYLVNDAPVTAEELPRLIAGWTRYEARVQFVPDPKADYVCVESALEMIKRANIGKFAFVGNEAYAPGPQQ